MGIREDREAQAAQFVSVHDLLEGLAVTEATTTREAAGYLLQKLSGKELPRFLRRDAQSLACFSAAAKQMDKLLRHVSSTGSFDDTIFEELHPQDFETHGLLTPDRTVSLHWTRNGKEKASIQMRTEVDRVILNYRTRSNGGEWQPMEYPVYLEWTPCHLGGRRVWFLCPAIGCGRRVAILFGDSIFACRHCHKLAYECQRETSNSRVIRRADNIRQRLGWEAGIANPKGSKPKGMHWRTFERLKAEHDAFANASWANMAEWLGLINWRRD